MLHRELGHRAAATLVDELAGLHCSDPDVQRQLQTLRRELLRHLADGEPWRARPALDAILMLDPPAWAVLRALLDAYPAVHASLTSSVRSLKIDPAAITFVARNGEIAVARAWLESLASALTG